MSSCIMMTQASRLLKAAADPLAAPTLNDRRSGVDEEVCSKSVSPPSLPTPRFVTPPPSENEYGATEQEESSGAGAASCPPSLSFNGTPRSLLFAPYSGPNTSTGHAVAYEYGQSAFASVHPSLWNSSSTSSSSSSLGLPSNLPTAASSFVVGQSWGIPPTAETMVAASAADQIQSSGEDDPLSPRTLQGVSDLALLQYSKEHLDPPTPAHSRQSPSYMYQSETPPSGAVCHALPAQSAAVGATPKPATRPTRLATEDDTDELNQTHCFVRKECLRIVEIKGDGEDSDSDSTSDSDDSYAPNDRRRTRRRSSSSKSAASRGSERLFPGRVGFQCAFCANVESSSDKDSMGIFFPKSRAAIYRQTCTWQRVHFQNCRHVPEAVADEYRRTKDEDTSRGRVFYWERSAKSIGLEDVTVNGRCGIKFAAAIA